MKAVEELSPQVNVATTCHCLGVPRATLCGVLLGARVSGREEATVDHEVLSGFFGESASEVIQILDEMVEKIPESDRMLVGNVVNAARRTDGTTNVINEDCGGTDDR